MASRFDIIGQSTSLIAIGSGTNTIGNVSVIYVLLSLPIEGRYRAYRREKQIESCMDGEF